MEVYSESEKVTSEDTDMEEQLLQFRQRGSNCKTSRDM